MQGNSPLSVGDGVGTVSLRVSTTTAGHRAHDLVRSSVVDYLASWHDFDF